MFFIFALSTLVSYHSFAEPPQTDVSMRGLVHLLDYMVEDYQEAVTDTGKIANKLEYQEQINLCKKAKSISAALDETKKNPELKNLFLNLCKQIDKKIPRKNIAPVAMANQVTATLNSPQK